MDALCIALRRRASKLFYSLEFVILQIPWAKTMWKKAAKRIGYARRDFTLLRVFLEEIFSMIYMIPFLIETWLSYKLNGDMIKNIRYSEPKACLLDYYFPLNSSCKATILFVQGGAWGFSLKEVYAGMARELQKLGYAVIIPDYTIYPNGTIGDLLNDVNACIEWTVKKKQTLSCTDAPLVLIGHSAGAHLISLALIHKLIMSKGGKICIPHPSKGNIDGYAQNWSFGDIHSVIGLAGPYDIPDHYKHEYKRCVAHISPMKPCMMNHENFDHSSPTILLRRNFLKDGNPQKVDVLPKIHLLHGGGDIVVPTSSSEKFAAILKDVGADVSCDSLPGVTHIDLWIDITLSMFFKSQNGRARDAVVGLLPK